jgi:hypothetical protein
MLSLDEVRHPHDDTAQMSSGRDARAGLGEARRQRRDGLRCVQALALALAAASALYACFEPPNGWPGAGRQTMLPAVLGDTGAPTGDSGDEGGTHMGQVDSPHEAGESSDAEEDTGSDGADDAAVDSGEHDSGEHDAGHDADHDSGSHDATTHHD